LGEPPEDWKKACVIHVFKKDKTEDPRSLRWSASVRFLGGDGPNLPGNNFQTLEGQEGDWEQSAWLKSWLTNLIAFCNEMMGLVLSRWEK